MDNLYSLILDHATPKMIQLMRYARQHGCALLVLEEKFDMMKPCYEYMTIVLQNAGIRVRHVLYKEVPTLKKELFMAFANIWVLKRNTLPLSVKRTPWIALQTEHPHHRVGARPDYIRYLQHCDQVWDFGLRFFKGTRSVFFPHMLYPASYMVDLSPSTTTDVVLAGKVDSKRKSILQQVKGSCRIIQKCRHLVRELSTCAISPMIPRQRGNFEFHRFASLISSGTYIIAEHTPGNEKIEAALRHAVEFVPPNRISTTINKYIDSPDAMQKRRRGARDWFIKQDHECLLKKIMEHSSLVDPVQFTTDEQSMRIIRGYIERREPFSLVRFGEGEARVLGISAKYKGSFEPPREKLRHQTGVVYGDKSIRALKNRIMVALREATMIGTVVNFKCEAEYVKWMKIVHTNVQLSRKKPCYNTGQFVNRQLQEHLDFLVEGRDKMSVITCRDLKQYIMEKTGIKDVKEYIVPSQHIVRHLVDGEHEKKHYQKRIWPDLHDQIQRDIVVREPGEVFIVAAGLFGKDLCITIQNRGGIAIDMGSSVDFWVNKRTRGKNKGLIHHLA